MEKIKDLILKLFKLENIAFNLTGYVESKLEILKLEIKADVAKAVSKAVTFIFLGLVCFLFLLFVSLAVAYSINSFFQGEYMGFFIVGSVYGFAFLILYFNRKKLSSNIEGHLLRSQKHKE